MQKLKVTVEREDGLEIVTFFVPCDMVTALLSGVREQLGIVLGVAGPPEMLKHSTPESAIARLGQIIEQCDDILNRHKRREKETNAL